MSIKLPILYLCVCVYAYHTHMYIVASSCVCTCGGERKMPDVFLCSVLPYSLKTGSLTELEAHYLARTAGRWAPQSYFSLPLLGSQAFVAMPSFLCVLWAFEASSSCLHSKCSYLLTHILNPHPVSSKETWKKLILLKFVFRQPQTCAVYLGHICPSLLSHTR